MFYYSKVPLLRLLLPFVIGVICAKQIDSQTSFLLSIGMLAMLFVVILIIFFFQKNTNFHYLNRWIFGVLSSLGLLFAGFSYSSQYDESLFVNLQESSNKLTWLGEVVCAEDNLDSSYNYQIKLISVQNEDKWEDIQFTVLVYSKNPNIVLKEGEIVSASGYLNSIEEPLNPKQFNFKKFSANRAIFFRSHENEFRLLGEYKSLRSIAAQSRKVLISWYVEMGIEKNELAVLTALTLGDKSRLSSDLKNDYAGAGAMHILAVSGLHVGIIYLLFSQLLKYFDKTWWQRIIKALLLLGIVWVYAILTGFSPSVQRAACMFSFIIISSALKRHSNIINSISGSAFLLILINPNILFEVGFQLSYSAVVGIVLIHPAIYPLFSSKYWLPDKVWSLMVVSIAAQLATFSLTIYYFHQFPNWFLLVNIFVIPLAFVIVSGALILITIWGVFQHDFYLAEVLNWVLKSLNYLIEISQKLPFAVTEGIWLSDLSVALLFIALVALIYFIVERRVKSFVICMSLLATIFLIESYKNVGQISKKYVGIYAFEDLTMCFVIGLKAEVLTTSSELNLYERKIVEDHLNSEGVQELKWIYVNDSLSTSSFFEVKAIENNLLISGMDQRFAVLNDLLLLDELKNFDFTLMLNKMDSDLSIDITKGQNNQIVFLASIKPWSQSHLDFVKEHEVKYLSRDGYLQLDISN